MSNETWEPVDEYGSVQDEFLVDHNRIWVGAVKEDEWIVLPDDIRLCRRVEPEPLTAKRLEREGWESEGFDESIWWLSLPDVDGNHSLRVEYMHRPEVWGVELVDNETGWSLGFDAKDMPQLRALVEMLQG